jgi:putative redox protein
MRDGPRERPREFLMSDVPLKPPTHSTSSATLRLQTVGGPGLRFGVRVGAHAFVLDSGPEAEGPSPAQVVLAALGGCTAMDVISILRKKRQQVTGYEVEVIAERRLDQHPRIFTRMEIIHRVRGRGINAVAVAEAIELSDTKYCVVHAMLEPAVAISSRFEITEE